MVWVHNSANLLLLYVIFLEVSLQGDCHTSAILLLMYVIFLEVSLQGDCSPCNVR